jgi:4-hydroxy-3-polyprenylbenzoate decarboxylase
MAPARIIVGISGATGIIYGLRTLRMLRDLEVETHLVVTKPGELTRAYETDYSSDELKASADFTYSSNDIGAAISSGSFQNIGMIVAPCSVRSLSEIAYGVTSNLLTRAADVALKERRKLVLLFRETPLHAGHLKSMLAVTEAGAIVSPPVPAFYIKPKSIDDIVDHTVGRVLDLFGLHHPSMKRWSGMDRKNDE